MQTVLHYPWKCVSSFLGLRPRCLSFREEGRRCGDNRVKSIKDISRNAARNKREWTSRTCTRIVDYHVVEMDSHELKWSRKNWISCVSGKSFRFDSWISQFKNREIRSREEGITCETVDEDGRSRMFEAVGVVYFKDSRKLFALGFQGIDLRTIFVEEQKSVPSTSHVLWELNQSDRFLFPCYASYFLVE